MKISDLKIDVNRFEQGAWVSDIPEMGTLRLKVRGIANLDWRKLQTKLIEAVPRKKRPGGRVDPDEQDRITTMLLNATCLLDWDGLETDDGDPLPYSQDVAGKLLSDPAMRRFRDAVSWAASQVSNDEAADCDDIAGNSKTSSAGSTAGATTLSTSAS